MNRASQSNGASDEQIRALRRENRELRKRLKAAEQSYRCALRAWAKDQISKKDLARWERQIAAGVVGGSLMELIGKLKTKLREP